MPIIFIPTLRAIPQTTINTRISILLIKLGIIRPLAQLDVFKGVA